MLVEMPGCVVRVCGWCMVRSLSFAYTLSVVHSRKTTPACLRASMPLLEKRRGSAQHYLSRLTTEDSLWQSSKAFCLKRLFSHPHSRNTSGAGSRPKICLRPAHRCATRTRGQSSIAGFMVRQKRQIDHGLFWIARQKKTNRCRVRIALTCQ